MNNKWLVIMLALISLLIVTWHASEVAIAKQCQTKTYFNVDKVKFECMEWKK